MLIHIVCLMTLSCLLHVINLYPYVSYRSSTFYFVQYNSVTYILVDHPTITFVQVPYLYVVPVSVLIVGCCSLYDISISDMIIFWKCHFPYYVPWLLVFYGIKRFYIVHKGCEKWLVKLTTFLNYNSLILRYTCTLHYITLHYITCASCFLMVESTLFADHVSLKFYLFN